MGRKRKAERSTPQPEEEKGLIRTFIDNRIEKGKDRIEFVRVMDDFWDITRAGKRLEEKQAAMQDLGWKDFWNNPDKIRDDVESINKDLKKIQGGLDGILKTDLRFSEAFLGDEVREVRRTIRKFKKPVARWFLICTNVWDREKFILGLPRFAAKVALTEERRDKLIDLGTSLRETRSLLQGIEIDLEACIDPSLERPSNNGNVNNILMASGIIKMTDAFDELGTSEGREKFLEGAEEAGAEDWAKKKAREAAADAF